MQRTVLPRPPAVRWHHVTNPGQCNVNAGDTPSSSPRLGTSAPFFPSHSQTAYCSWWRYKMVMGLAAWVPA